jgi:AcrR family transcriptional regulator
VRPDFQRARQPAQKELRRAHLLATARSELGAGVSLRALSLSELARQAGMAKANVYTYFESREALLLALLWDEWQQWFARLEAAPPRRGRRPETLDDVADALARSLVAAPLLCELTAALPTVLEQNLSEDAIRKFKLDAVALFGAVAAHLAARSPLLPARAYAELIHDAAHAIIGLHPSTHPAPAAARALADPALRFFRRDFATELQRFVRALAAAHASTAAGSATRTARTR